MNARPGASRWLVAAAAGLAALAAGCASTSASAFRLGEQAERRQEWDKAIVEYSKAVQANPDKVLYRASLARARLRGSEEHARSGRLLLGRGLYKEAIDELRLALDLNPGSPGLLAELKDADQRQKAGARAASLDELKQRVREKALQGLGLGPEAREPLGLSFRNASLREAYLALGKAAGVNIVFDPQFQDQTVSVDLRDVPFEQALSALSSVGKTFHRVIDTRLLQVIPDNPNKRREYEQQVVKTFFLSNADLKETIDLLRIVLGARRVASLPGDNALTINDTPDKVAAAERIIDVLDKKRAEVVVEVEILEVNRSRLREYGIQIASPVAGGNISSILDGTLGVAAGAGPDPSKTATLEKNPYTKANLVVTGLPGVIARLLETDATTRVLANPQLRASEGQTAQARFGDQVPVPVTTFTPIASGGLSQQPITSFEYKNVGVNIDITPRVHHDGEVTLTLKLEISQVGPLFQNLPTFNSRSLTSVLRLKDGETNLIAGLISNNERENLSGTPGLAKLPVLGKLFSRSRKEIQETDIVMTLTPHVVRRPELTEEDLRSFQLGSETTPLLFEVPAIPPVSREPRPSESPRVEPIRPPTPTPTPTPLP